jgi:hypothetical protein
MPAASLQPMTSQLPGPDAFLAGFAGTGDDGIPAALFGPDRPADKIGRRRLRIAAVDALDRWLQLPVNDALIQTERAVVRAEAAALLGGGPVRDGLLADALSLARAAQPELEGFLGQLALPVPAALLRGIRRLVDGVVALANNAEDADDLRVVAKVSERVLVARGKAAPRRLRRGTWLEPHPVGRPADGLLDPRLVPARVVRFSDDPALGEVRLTPTEVGGIPVLEVEIAAVGSPGRRDEAAARDRLYARFVDASAGTPRVHARLLLTYEPARCVFTARLPLEEGVDPAQLWVEIVDAAIDRPPAAGRSEELIGIRRAAVLLRRWRLLASCRQLGIVAQPELVRTVRSVSDDRMTPAGPDAPLVAELAYAYEASVASA